MSSTKGKVRINVYDLIGKRVGNLRIVGYNCHNYSYTKGGPRMRHYYDCICDCGNVTVVQRAALKNNKTHSCGCSKKWRKSNGN